MIDKYREQEHVVQSIGKSDAQRIVEQARFKAKEREILRVLDTRDPAEEDELYRR
jgi:hypothetical protein